MATKKITLNELRSIIKQIIKENNFNGSGYAVHINLNEDHLGNVYIGDNTHFKAEFLLDEAMDVISQFLEKMRYTDKYANMGNGYHTITMYNKTQTLDEIYDVNDILDVVQDYIDNIDEMREM